MIIILQKMDCPMGSLFCYSKEENSLNACMKGLLYFYVLKK